MAVKPLTLMAPATALSGPELFYAQQSGVDSKVTSTQIRSPGIIDGRAYMVADGATDDTVGFQNAINAAVAINGILLLPAGQANITSTVNVTGPVTVRGSGESNLSTCSRLFWNGASTTIPLLDLQGVRDSYFSDFCISASGTHPLGFAIRSTTTTGRTATANQFVNIRIDGTVSYIDKGFAFVAGSAGNNNNDANVFINVQINNYATAAWSFEHSQSKAHSLIDCGFQGGSGQTNQYGVTNALGTGAQGGSFKWFGGTGGNNADCDFFLGSPNDPIAIQGGNFENSSRFVRALNGSSTWAVTLTENRFSANSLNADGKAIIYGFVGPLNLYGNVIGEDGSKALKIDMPSGNSPIGTAIGNVFGTSLTTPFINGAWTSLNNQLNSPSTGIVPNTTIGGYPAVTIANLPTCNLISVGQQATVSNGQTSPAWNGAVSTTGAVYAPVTCVQTGASTYGWVYR